MRKAAILFHYVHPRFFQRDIRFSVDAIIDGYLPTAFGRGHVVFYAGRLS